MAAGQQVGGRGQYPGERLLHLLKSQRIGRLRRYRKGDVLYHEGDAAERIFVVKKGAVKVCTVSRDGKELIYAILGAGRLAGALVGEVYQTTAVALRDAEVYVLSTSEFEQLIAENPHFSAAVVRALTQSIYGLTETVRELSFMEVEQRLKHTLLRLAEEHGVETENGVKLDLSITHEELAQMISASRSTVTFFLNKLEQVGLLRRQGRQLILIPPEHFRILEGLRRAVVEGDDEEAKYWAVQAVDAGVNPIQALNALTEAMRQVDRGFSRGDLALADVIVTVYAVKSVLPILQQAMRGAFPRPRILGTVVIGTVRGDIHDIGKTMVSSLLTVAGFDVVDLGVDVPAWTFVEVVQQTRPQILALSSLMTTTVSEQAEVIQLLAEKRVRDQVKVMVGGGAVTPELARQMGADGYAPTAHSAVELAKRLIRSPQM